MSNSSRISEQRNGVFPFECVALVLQGGGALGAYQAGVYEALAEANINPDWVAGVSIGAINSAIIAGNEPAERVAKLRAFWQEITANPLVDWAIAVDALTPKGDLPRALFNQLSATYALIAGAAGFFTLRQPAPWLHPNGALEATSFYETKHPEEHARAACRLRPDQCRRDALQRRRGERAHRQFRLLRQRNAYDPAGARDGERIASARLSRRWRSRASSTGTEVSSRTRRCSGSSSKAPARTCSPSRSISGARAARSPAIWPTS